MRVTDQINGLFEWHEETPCRVSQLLTSWPPEDAYGWKLRVLSSVSNEGGKHRSPFAGDATIDRMETPLAKIAKADLALNGPDRQLVLMRGHLLTDLQIGKLMQSLQSFGYSPPALQEERIRLLKEARDIDKETWRLSLPKQMLAATSAQVFMIAMAHYQKHDDGFEGMLAKIAKERYPELKMGQGRSGISTSKLRLQQKKLTPEDIQNFADYSDLEDPALLKKFHELLDPCVLPEGEGKGPLKPPPDFSKKAAAARGLKVQIATAQGSLIELLTQCFARSAYANIETGMAAFCSEQNWPLMAPASDGSRIQARSINTKRYGSLFLKGMLDPEFSATDADTLCNWLAERSDADKSQRGGWWNKNDLGERIRAGFTELLEVQKQITQSRSTGDDTGKGGKG